MIAVNMHNFWTITIYGHILSLHQQMLNYYLFLVSCGLILNYKYHLLYGM